MLAFLIAVFVLLVFLASCYGWGRFMFGQVYRVAPSSPAFCITLGLGTWVVIGGLLNLARISYGFSLEIILAIGLVLLALDVNRLGSSNFFRFREFFASVTRASSAPLLIKRFSNLVPLVLLLFATAFHMLTVLPTGAVNFHDDFHKYLVAPYRMLQTGSLGGTAFEYLGFLYLGAQSYLQAFVLSRFPIGYVNGFDLVFCFFVAGLLLNDIGLKAKAHWSFRTLALATFVVLHPQYVNISAIYSGILFIFGMIYGTMLLLDALRDSGSRSAMSSGIPLAVFCSSLVALKGNFVPFAGAYMAICFAFCGLVIRKWHATSRTMGVFVLTAVVILTPWVAMSSNNLLTAITKELGNIASQASVLTAEMPDVERWRHLFSAAELTYGGSFLEYHLAVVAILLGAIMAVLGFARSARKPERDYTIVFAFAGLAAVVSHLFLIQRVAVEAVGLRYSVPLIIAGSSLVFLALDARLLSWQPDWSGMARRLVGVSAMLLVLFQVAVVASFVDTFVRFKERAIENQNILSFNHTPSYVTQNQMALGPSMRAYVRYVQSKGEEGARIFAWIATPFHLDFARNTILTVDSANLVLQRLSDRSEPDQESLRRSLRLLGIDYVMWQYQGFGVRTLERLARRMRTKGYKSRAEAEYKLVVLVSELIKSSEVLYADNAMVFADITKPKSAEH